MRRGLGLHVLGLTAVLLVFVSFVGTDGIVSADEGAMLAELDLIERTGSWSLPNPEPVVDPEMLSLPLELSERSDEGRWAPFAKHPVHIAVLRPAYAIAGYGGVLVLSVAGVVAAAIAAAVIAARIRPRSGPVALWLTGVGSPLLFDVHQVVGHALGAGLAGIAVVLALQSDDRLGRTGRLLRLVGVGAFVAVLALVRAEGVLLGLAVGAAFASVGAYQRRPWLLAAGAVSGIAAALVRLVEPSLLDAALGSDSVGTAPSGSGGGSSGFLAGRWSGFRTTVLEPGYGLDGGETLLLLALIAIVAAAAIWRWRRDDQLVRLLMVVSAALSVGWLLSTDFLVPGLLAAFPIAAAGLVGIDRPLVRHRDAAPVLLAAILFASAVVLTQYETGGTGEWGGRYYAIGLPLLVPLAVAGLATLGEGMSSSTKTVAVGALAVISVTVAAGAVREARDAKQASRRTAELVVAATDALEVDAVVSTTGAISRFAWDEVLSRRWLTTRPDRLPDLAGELADDGVDQVALLTREPDRDVPELADIWGAEVTEPFSGLSIVMLTRR